MSIFHATILSIFPEIFPGSLGFSLSGKALKDKIWSFNVINIRDYGIGNYRRIDDTMYGGGDGLIMRPDVLGKALDYALSGSNSHVPIYYPSPRGQLFSQNLANKILEKKKIILLCGRFEGIDQRIIEEYNIEELSIGDYILSGGELASMVILDSVIRLIPGVIQNSNALSEESFTFEYNGSKLLEYPLYTKPNLWKGRSIPEALLSGDPKKIIKWKQEQAFNITKSTRPDLIKK
ncbi:tRNA (guanosine(37)-N1)-methyltransferase TrmD [Rickettsia endosymbiont of Cardiosporidium cionae]|uniref:tRNA (guanosine(37)-N1)-methyltransferase TrmD n=1 Tax=Rickettsia endosymbiont of Cardiosporidium cionae TaxID=2777155 RepID=UPI00189386B0|nr:tRNA (guanosine(37)-N1)-methyltransferase TrmD [Rickettsia endosymbiont of Cardiosporidium cionae]KAF8818841.1 tRNA (guanosine(37)-N1)-methyltransferase TrmD [Rickettsia endosymbiont of Cardiosporidium cionae]